MRLLVFDSSFLIAVVEHPTSWYEDIVERIGKFDPVILECVKWELERITSRPTRRGRFAALALEAAKSFQSEKCGGASTDAEIISFAKSHNAAVATVDGQMVKRLRRMKVVVFTLRSGRVALS